MEKIINNIDFKEFNLTLIRIAVFMNHLYHSRKHKITKERLIIYDFYLRYPNFLERNEILEDFNLKYSYFHWKPDYQQYNAAFSILISRGLLSYNRKDGECMATDKNAKFIENIPCKYVENLQSISSKITSELNKLNMKKLNENIVLQVNKVRGWE